MVLVLLLSSALSDAENGNDTKLAGHAVLAQFLGEWEGVGQEGRFREVARYSWGPGETHLLVDMMFYFDGQRSGSARGFFCLGCKSRSTAVRCCHRSWGDHATTPGKSQHGSLRDAGDGQQRRAGKLPSGIQGHYPAGQCDPISPVKSGLPKQMVRGCKSWRITFSDGRASPEPALWNRQNRNQGDTFCQLPQIICIKNLQNNPTAPAKALFLCR